MKSSYLLFLIPLLALTHSAQVDSDETTIRKIYDEALVKGVMLFSKSSMDFDIK